MNETPPAGPREGSLEAPTRHAIAWRSSDFYDEAALFKELGRVFDICHGCRRCFSLCESFPTLFDAIDASSTGELDAVDKRVYWQVVDNCYLCDMCFMTKCPYVPPHPWNLDFPHLMLRAKAVRARQGHGRWRDRVLSATDTVGMLAGIPVVAQLVNASNASKLGRQLLDKVMGVHPEAPLPEYHVHSARARLRSLPAPAAAVQASAETRGRVVLFTTCYGNRNEPELATDLAAVLAHNGIEVRLAAAERCCGMPKLEMGDLEAVARLKQFNIPQLLALVEQGFDIVAPIPSCVLMFKQELPLMFPEDADVQRVKSRIFDPFEYLMLRHKAGLLRTDFRTSLGRITYHVPCHLRVQNIGLKTRDVLKLVPGTSIETIERCSGHDGTYALKSEFRAAALKIGRPVVQKVQAAAADHYTSDCPMAGHQIASGLAAARDAAAAGAPVRAPEHPLALLRLAYGI